ncbi:MAG: hypothetical protein WBS14_22075, partial [Rhodomicrobium sp.]
RWIFVAGHVQASLIFLYRIHNPAAAREIVPLLQSLGLSSTLYRPVFGPFVTMTNNDPTLEAA